MPVRIFWIFFAKISVSARIEPAPGALKANRARACFRSSMCPSLLFMSPWARSKNRLHNNCFDERSLAERLSWSQFNICKISQVSSFFTSSRMARLVVSFVPVIHLHLPYFGCCPFAFSWLSLPSVATVLAIGPNVNTVEVSRVLINTLYPYVKAVLQLAGGLLCQSKTIAVKTIILHLDKWNILENLMIFLFDKFLFPFLWALYLQNTSSVSRNCFLLAIFFWK